MCIPHTKIHSFFLSPSVEKIRLLNQKRGVSPSRPEPCTSQISLYWILLLAILFMIIFFVTTLLNFVYGICFAIGFVCGSFYYWFFLERVLK
jgi:hypothetical protein